uniref:Uncharacterized protein n=1 Tax=Arundo donax TaxID=35708 RepID=A0A0A8YM97_ARUDO
MRKCSDTMCTALVFSVKILSS